MPPRTANNAVTYAQRETIHWLQYPVLKAKWGNQPSFVSIPLKEEFAAGDAEIFDIDQKVKHYTSFSGFDTLAKALIDTRKGDTHPTTVSPIPMWTEDGTFDAIDPTQPKHQARWRKAQVIATLLRPVSAMLTIERREAEVLKPHAVTRRFNPHLEGFRDVYRPLAAFLSEEAHKPRVLFTHPDIDTIYDQCKEGFERFKSWQRGSEFRRQLEAQRRSLNKLSRSTVTYIDHLLDTYGGVSTLYLDVGHTPSAGLPPFVQCKEDFNRFWKLKYTHPLFKRCIGFFWKLQYSPVRHYHHHLFLFFRHEEGNRWTQLRDAISALWIEEITQQTGIVYQIDKERNSRNHALLTPDIKAIAGRGTPAHQQLIKMLDALIRTDSLTYLELPKGFKSAGRGQVSKT